MTTTTSSSEPPALLASQHCPSTNVKSTKKKKTRSPSFHSSVCDSRTLRNHTRMQCCLCIQWVAVVLAVLSLTSGGAPSVGDGCLEAMNLPFRCQYLKGPHTPQCCCPSHHFHREMPAPVPRPAPPGIQADLYGGNVTCFPTLIIIGAQKSGSTALYAYLSLHPQFRSTVSKEMHLFDGDWSQSDGLPPSSEFGKYASRLPFTAAPNASAGLTGETTPSYIMHNRAARQIYKLLPHTRLVLILRNPIDRAYSEFHMHVSHIHPSYQGMWRA